VHHLKDELLAAQQWVADKLLLSNGNGTVSHIVYLCFCLYRVDNKERRGVSEERGYVQWELSSALLESFYFGLSAPKKEK
jgi:hypothetical protein